MYRGADSLRRNASGRRIGIPGRGRRPCTCKTLQFERVIFPSAAYSDRSSPSDSQYLSARKMSFSVLLRQSAIIESAAQDCRLRHAAEEKDIFYKFAVGIDHVIVDKIVWQQRRVCLKFIF